MPANHATTTSKFPSTIPDGDMSHNHYKNRKFVGLLLLLLLWGITQIGSSQHVLAPWHHDASDVIRTANDHQHHPALNKNQDSSVPSNTTSSTTVPIGPFEDRFQNDTEPNKTLLGDPPRTTDQSVTATPTTKNTTNTNNPFARIILMGQFNKEDLPNESIQTWHDTHQQVGFQKVLVRGTFSNATKVQQLKALGINAQLTTCMCEGPNYSPQGKRDSRFGFYSPLHNLRQVLADIIQEQEQQIIINNNNHKTHSLLQGVLYAHDDAILNLSVLARILQETNYEAIIGTNLGRTVRIGQNIEASYEDIRRHQRHTFPVHSETNKNVSRPNGSAYPTNKNKKKTPVLTATLSGSPKETTATWKNRMSQLAYRIYPNRPVVPATNSSSSFHGPFSNWNGSHSYFEFAELEQYHLDDWYRRNQDYCYVGQYHASQDPRAKPYLEQDETTGEDYMLFPPYTQADFLYVPMTYAQAFVSLAELMKDHGIWLECAVPTIVDQLRHLYNDVSVQVTPLCSIGGRGRRKGTPVMVRTCQLPQVLRSFVEYGVYHPVKLTSNTTLWRQVYEHVNGNWTRSRSET